MLEMRTILKKIRPEENCYRYYEMVLRKEGANYIFQKRWGRLRYGLQPIYMRKTESVLSNREAGIDRLLKTLYEKEKRGYTLSDELRLI